MRIHSDVVYLLKRVLTNKKYKGIVSEGFKRLSYG
jgi:hypothetical protein